MTIAREDSLALRLGALQLPGRDADSQVRLLERAKPHGEHRDDTRSWWSASPSRTPAAAAAANRCCRRRRLAHTLPAQFVSPRWGGWLGDHQDEAEAAELAALLHEAAPKLAFASLRAPRLPGSGRTPLPKARSYEVSESVRDRLRAAAPIPTGALRGGCVGCREALPPPAQRCCFPPERRRRRPLPSPLAPARHARALQCPVRVCFLHRANHTSPATTNNTGNVCHPRPLRPWPGGLVPPHGHDLQRAPQIRGGQRGGGARGGGGDRLWRRRRGVRRRRALSGLHPGWADFSARGVWRVGSAGHKFRLVPSCGDSWGRWWGDGGAMVG